MRINADILFGNFKKTSVNVGQCHGKGSKIYSGDREIGYPCNVWDDYEDKDGEIRLLILFMSD